MTEPLPPLPDDEADLEALMSKHLETVEPGLEVRARIFAHLDPQPTTRALPLATLAAAAAIVVGVALGVAFWGGEPQGKPPQTDGLAQQGDAPQPPGPGADPDELVEDPETPDDPITEPDVPMDPDDPEVPVEADVEVVAWTFKPGKPDMTEGDMDYGQLKLLLEAKTIVVGTVAAVDTNGAATLKGVEVLRGVAPTKAPTVGEFNGCEGVPSFEHYVGKQVCVFLTEREGELQILHGGSGIQALPFRGKLDALNLAELIRTKTLSDEQLDALVADHGLAVLNWLEAQVADSVYRGSDERIDARLAAVLEGLNAGTPRQDAVAMARFFVRFKLSDEAFARLEAYERTFFATRLGAWVKGPQGKPGYSNRPEDHVAFLRFMADVRPVRVLELLKAECLPAFERKEQPAVFAKQYQALQKQIAAELIEDPK